MSIPNIKPGDWIEWNAAKVRFTAVSADKDTVWYIDNRRLRLESSYNDLQTMPSGRWTELLKKSDITTGHEEFSIEPKVIIAKLPECQYVTFWCPMCNTTHSFTGRLPGQIVRSRSSAPVFFWNGDLVKPSIDDICVVNHTTENIHRGQINVPCHLYMKYGRLDGYRDKDGYQTEKIRWKHMLPVSQWPLRKPPGDKA